MVNIKVSEKPLLNLQLDAYAYLLEHEFDFTALKEIIKNIYPPLEFKVKQKGFSGKAGSSLIITGIQDGKSVYILLLGVGDLKKRQTNIERLRRATGSLVRFAENHKVRSIGLTLPDPVNFELSYKRLAQEISTIAHKASYNFDEFITEPDRKITWDFDFYISVSKKAELQNIKSGVNNGIVIGNAINTSRYWCDMPPSSFTPSIFAKKAQELAKKYKLKVTIFNEKEIIKMGMGGLAGVSRGSDEECRLVTLEYKSKLRYAPTIVFVGKGVTFDSGGLSIKPAPSMETMKDDMAGAATVLATMQVIAQLKPDINVIAVAPMAENLPSGSAIKPGDILKFYNGKTAEVLNTDAEGRLILADALSYAVKEYKPDAIIDLATLTGACAYFLGPFYCGLLSQHDVLVNKIYKASQLSGDRVWRLPMDDDYRPAIRSDVADISNIGSQKYKAGAITAAFFLQNFVGNVPWAHLDIAGVAFGVPDMTYLRTGATGFGIRLLTDLALNWKEWN